MNFILNNVTEKIKTLSEIKVKVSELKLKNKKVVFTNGCFDILHFGHLSYLSRAKELGDFLIVALNSSASVSRLKGAHRPINDDLTRNHMIASLEFVDAVIIFDENTPIKLIKEINPDILVKGGDWSLNEIIGSEIVLDSGGQVKSLAFIEGYSTTSIESKILEQGSKNNSQKNQNTKS